MLTWAENFPYTCGQFSLHVRKDFRTCKELNKCGISRMQVLRKANANPKEIECNS